MIISEARFQQLATIGRKNNMPRFTLEQMNKWREGREQRVKSGGPFTVMVTGTDGCAKHILEATMPLLRELTSGKITFVEAPIGWEAMQQAGITNPLDDIHARFPESTWLTAMESDAILLGAVGSEWDDPSKHPELSVLEKPQYALMQLRSSFDLFANVRPSRFFRSLRHLSPLKPELIKGIDEITVVRELTRGLYFGEPKGWIQPRSFRSRLHFILQALFSNKEFLVYPQVDKKNQSQEAVDAMRYNEEEIERVMRAAFELAKAQGKRLASFDKENILVSSKLWRRVANRVAEEYKGVSFSNWYVDIGLAKLVATPTEFDFIVTENMFGDITGDILGGLTVGSIGMIPSGGYGDGSWPNYFEPVHGSAPKRFPASGKLEDSIVNPLATILSAEMMLRFLGLNSFAQTLMQAVEKTLNQRYRTYDIFRNLPGEKKVGTLNMVQHVGENINHILGTKKEV